MMKKIVIIALFAGYLFLLPACKGPKVRIPSDIIPEKKMQQVMIDVLTAEAYGNIHGFPADTTKNITNRLYNQIFQKYNITKAEYYKSYDFYARHPALFEKDMQPVLDSLNAMDARMPGSAITIPNANDQLNNPVIRNMPRPIK